MPWTVVPWRRESEEWMVRLMDVWNAGEHERFVDELGPGLVFSPDPSFPDAGTYQGEEFRQWMRDWISTWEENPERDWLTRQSMGVCSCLRDLVA